MSNPFKKHNCLPYTFRDLTSERNLSRLSMVTTAKHAREKEFGSEFVILDALGDCLVQGLWTDTFGNFALLRRLPYRTETPELAAAMQLLIADIRAILGGKETFVEVEGDEGSFRIYSLAAEHSIGD